MGILITILVIAGAILLILKFLPKGKTGKYRLKSGLLTPTELRFWDCLKTATPENTLVTFKQRLADIFEPASTGDKQERWAAFNKIKAKHVDFLLITGDGKPSLAVELDDSSHMRSDRVARDAFVDSIFAATRLPILHVPAKSSYSQDALRAAINEKLATNLSKIPGVRQAPAAPTPDSDSKYAPKRERPPSSRKVCELCSTVLSENEESFCRMRRAGKSPQYACRKCQ